MGSTDLFDVIFFNVWYPDRISTKYVETKFLYSMKEVAGFFDRSAIKEKTSNMMARTAFHQLFVPNGLPRLMIVDDRSAFKGLVPAF